MTEATPLMNTTNAVMQSVNKVITSKNISAMNNVAQEKWIEVRNSVQDGEFSIRLIALLSAVALIITSTFGFIGAILTLSIKQSVIELYSLIFGAIMILLESKQLHLVSFQKYLDKLFHYALFIKYVWGRGILYLFAGSIHLLLPNSSVMDIIIGIAIVLVGVLYIITGKIATHKLKVLRQSLHNNTQIKKKFHAADTTKKGLSYEQFKALITDELGLDINHREAEVIFLHLDKSADGLLSYEEFQGWWTDLEENYIF